MAFSWRKTPLESRRSGLLRSDGQRRAGSSRNGELVCPCIARRLPTAAGRTAPVESCAAAMEGGGFTCRDYRHNARIESEQICKIM